MKKPEILTNNPKVVALWEAYERDGPGCAMYLHKADAEACEAFENGCDLVRLSNVRIEDKDMETLNAHKPIFA
jgi:hypothetical protein